MVNRASFIVVLPKLLFSLGAGMLQVTKLVGTRRVLCVVSAAFVGPSTSICQYPELRSKVKNYEHPDPRSNASSLLTVVIDMRLVCLVSLITGNPHRMASCCHSSSPVLFLNYMD